MAPKKKALVSGFGLLMKQQQEKYAAQGFKYSMAQMKDIADPIWKAMAPEERAMYNSNAKICRRNTPDEKYASDGTLIQHNVQLEEEKDVQERQMVRDIRSLFGESVHDPNQFKMDAKHRQFYIMSFNILCRTKEGIYVPLELSIAEYSIQRGITNQMHKFIYPGPVPLGYTGEAKRHGEDTHLIPFNGHQESVRNYKDIVMAIEKFLNPDENYDHDFFPVFTRSDMMDQTAGCIQWLYDKAGYKYMVHVWDLSHLLTELRASSGAPISSHYLAREWLSNNAFDYTIGTRCAFHEDNDSAFCTLGCCLRLCYLLSDYLCSVFGIEPTAQHLPNRALSNKPYQVYQPCVSKDSHSTTSSLPRSMQSSSSALYDFENYSDEESETASAMSSRYGPPRSVTSSMAQLNLKSHAPGQGIGRGQRRNL